VLEQTRIITGDTLRHYLPDIGSNLPAIVNKSKS